MGGGYGVKYLFDQKRDIEEAKVKQQELLVSEQKHAQEIANGLKKQEQEEAKTNIHRDFSKLKEENSDTVAWLYVKGTEINMPIVKSDDNTYYLTHGYNKKYNSLGWVFADYQNTFPELSTNTIIYGHTYKRTTNYSTLKDVLEDKWLNNKENHKITLDTEKERLTFEVFSIYTLEETNDYLQISFKTKEKYQKYLNKSIKRSIKKFDTTPTTDDKILTLSTCYIDANHRLVVQAKLIDS